MQQGEGKHTVGEYATPPNKVQPGPWRVNFQVRPDPCQPRARYRWSVEGKTFEPPPECQFEFEFPRECAYEVRLDVRSPRGNSTSRATVVVQDWLIVSLGDSVASGEGNPDIPRKRGAVWADEGCHCSSLAGTAQAALALERGDRTTSATFVHLACSGATIWKVPDATKRPAIEKVLIPPPEGKPFAAQGDHAPSAG